MQRRDFLKQCGMAAGALCLSGSSLAESATFLTSTRMVRVRGVVQSNGKGIAGVAVSDGLNVEFTGADGSFTLISDGRRPLLYITRPSGFSVPLSPDGIPQFYLPIRPDSRGEMTAGFELRPSVNEDTGHSFLVLADPQLYDEEDALEFRTKFIPDILETKRTLKTAPAFSVSCGDLVFDRPHLFPGYIDAVRAMSLPAFQVLGNHDVDTATRTDPASTRTFRNLFGPPYYSFNYGDIHYVVLDSVFWYGQYIGYLTQDQLDWLARDLAHVEHGKTVVAFMHIPPFTTKPERNENQGSARTLLINNHQLMFEIMKPYRTYYVCGHLHESEYLRIDDAEVHVCGAVCGGWWSGPICGDGTPRGYSVYEARGGELRWTYKSAGFDFKHQMRLSAPGSDPEHPDELIANVWSADDRWKITWYEDGQPGGEMIRRRGLDPMAVSLYAGDQLPAKHKWVEPAITDHLYYARPSADCGKVVVEARDPWGNVYTKTWHRSERL